MPALPPPSTSAAPSPRLKPTAQVDQQTVNYRPGATGRNCGNCSMFLPPAECSAVKGAITAEGVCDLWAAKKGLDYPSPSMEDQMLGGPALMEGRMP